MEIVSILIGRAEERDTQSKIFVFLPLGQLKTVPVETMAEEIKKLPGLVQLLLLLRYYDNMTNEETAALLQIQQEAVCDSLSRAIRFLGRRLDAHIHEQDVGDALQFAIEQENYPADRIRRLRSDLEKRLMN